MSRERPILFSGPMVRAILEGRKTQTRRVFKGQTDKRSQSASIDYGRAEVCFATGKGSAWCCPLKFDYGEPGDRLWVRETCLIMKAKLGTLDASEVMYADHEDYDICRPSKGQTIDLGWRVTPSIHMPRWASRLSLEITEVRVERLQEITHADAIAEGIEWAARWERSSTGGFAKGDGPMVPPPLAQFSDLWDSLNAKRDGGAYSWERNPYVWVISFRRVES